MDTKTLPHTLNLRLADSGSLQLQAAGEAAAPRRFSGIANSGRAFGLGSWQTVIDFDGIKLKDKTAFLLDHSGSKRAGVGRLSVTSDGLLADGVLLDNEHGRAVAAESDQGFPWEMSVYVQSARTEELSVGATISVNGREIAGPALIMRDCTIREVSFTAVGVDSNTHAVALSDDGRPIAPPQITPTPTQGAKKMSMTDAEKAEMDQLKADNAELQKTVAELKKGKKKADTDAKLAAAGFKLAANGEFEGLSQATYNMLLAADDNAVAAVIADIKPVEAAKPNVPDALLSDTAKPGDAQSGAAKLSIATGESQFLKGAKYV
jgi:hypothetical protein